jgi:hypothetical protein
MTKPINSIKQLTIRELSYNEVESLPNSEKLFPFRSDAYFLARTGFLELCSIDNRYYIVKEIETGKTVKITPELRKRLIDLGENLYLRF